MARKKKGSRQPKFSQETLTFQMTGSDMNTNKYIDIGQCLSKYNRKLHRQGYIYDIESIQVVGGSDLTGLFIGALSPNWVTRNAWTKAYALWQQMNFKVLEDNPSVKGKWSDFKVFFDHAHVTGGTTSSGPNLNLKPVGFDVTDVAEDGEWVMSTFVQPQHDVNPADGKVLAADEYSAHMYGPNVAGAGSPDVIKSGGIVHAYADTRARVDASPTVPGDMSESWMTLLTDDGSQEPELADVIESANDLPPYAESNYPGGDTNLISGINVANLTTDASKGNNKDWAFNIIAPLGLLKLYCYQAADAAVKGCWIQIKLRSRTYEMSQSGSVKKLYHDLKGNHGVLQ